LIVFKYVRWKNLLSTGNQFTEIQLDRNPTTLIIGENGSGKSTILDALCFGLFGKPFRNINKPQLLNSVNMAGCEVEIEFKIGSKNIKVIRGIKPNIFEIYINGKMYNQDANVRDYQKYLEQQILKLNYRSFTQVVILGSSTFIPFMQLKAKQRREVVEDILDIQIFSLMNMLLKQKLKTITEDQREAKYSVELTTEKITLQNKYIDDVKKNKNKLIKEKTKLVTGNEEEISNRQEKIGELKQSNDDLAFNSKQENEQSEKVQKLKGLHEQLKVRRSATNKYIGFFENNDDCPTCEQHIDETFKENMIVSKKSEYEKFDSGIKDLLGELEKQETIYNAIQDYIQQIRENDAEIGKINYSIKEMEKFNATLQTEIDQLQSGEISKEDTNKLKELKKSLKSFEKQQQKLREDQTYAEAVRNMLQDTGIKTKIIKQYLPIMNKLINTYLTSMEFYVNFTLDEKFSETIKSRFRDEFTYESFSEGEKMRIDLALLFTWRAVAKMKNSTNTNLLMLDEIFDSSLDSTGTDEFLKILNTLGDENVFVISHKQDMLVDKFKSTIRFQKIKNFSHVVE
jgi:DNA repair exonuclease SbcCD ATPase subunit|tara:strand:- start:1040 stop:2749 length:1710 start_codon:yes stop_codon:yes gene_type:complete